MRIEHVSTTSHGRRAYQQTASRHHRTREPTLSSPSVAHGAGARGADWPKGSWTRWPMRHPHGTASACLPDRHNPYEAALVGHGIEQSCGRHWIVTSNLVDKSD